MGEACDTPVLVGKVSGLHGVRGWVKVVSYTDPRENILHYRPWLVASEGGWIERELRDQSTDGARIRVRFAGIDDRDAATNLVGADIGIVRARLPEPESGYYWADLVGLRVVTGSGDALGRIERLFETGANDVMVVRDGDRERLIPFIEPAVVTAVDFDQGVIRVEWDPEF